MAGMGRLLQERSGKGQTADCVSIPSPCCPKTSSTTKRRGGGLIFITSMLASSVYEARMDRMVINSVRGENGRIGDIGEEEACNHYRSNAFERRT